MAKKRVADELARNACKRTFRFSILDDVHKGTEPMKVMPKHLLSFL